MFPLSAGELLLPRAVSRRNEPAAPAEMGCVHTNKDGRHRNEAGISRIGAPPFSASWTYIREPPGMTETIFKGFSVSAACISWLGRLQTSLSSVCSKSWSGIISSVIDQNFHSNMSSYYNSSGLRLLSAPFSGFKTNHRALQGVCVPIGGSTNKEARALPCLSRWNPDPVEENPAASPASAFTAELWLDGAPLVHRLFIISLHELYFRCVEPEVCSSLHFFPGFTFRANVLPRRSFLLCVASFVSEPLRSELLLLLLSFLVATSTFRLRPLPAELPKKVSGKVLNSGSIYTSISWKFSTLPHVRLPFPLSFLSPSRSLLPSSVSHKASGGVRISSCRDAPLQRQTRREALRRPAQKSVWSAAEARLLDACSFQCVCEWLKIFLCWHTLMCSVWIYLHSCNITSADPSLCCVTKGDGWRPQFPPGKVWNHQCRHRPFSSTQRSSFLTHW